mmetsp:Transcript_9458/g.34696  ORF Transcript_9458/g.34696 Transcript_9458/m.34696 type:complete len:597 (-) Transcript_9458:169-1959(-)
MSVGIQAWAGHGTTAAHGRVGARVKTQRHCARALGTGITASRLVRSSVACIGQRRLRCVTGRSPARATTPCWRIIPRAQHGSDENTKETARRALEINLDPCPYGSIAEIGAGQEVARWFFLVGAAAGTVAKSVSAYDMTISDTMYGRAERYVTKDRLDAMLEYEYLQCALPLKVPRGKDTRFFAFADTVTTKAFKRNNECHGWMGLKWQMSASAEPSRILLHVRMLDKTAQEQQLALGILGVNLIYACFYQSEYISGQDSNYSAFLTSLISDLSRDRIEIDYVEVDGAKLAHVDNRVMMLRLCEAGLTDGVMFDRSGQPTLGGDLLRKKNVLVQRGSFKPFTKLNDDMMISSSSLFFCPPDATAEKADSCVAFTDSVALMELTLKDLRETGDELDWTEKQEQYLKRSAKDFLLRVDTLAEMGYPTLVSNFFEYFRLANYLQRYTREEVVITLGVPTVKELFKEKYYTDLDGGILENFGRLLRVNIKLYVYPTVDPETDTVIAANDLKVDPEVQLLYDFLLQRGAIVAIDNYDEEVLRNSGQYRSSDILQLIAQGDDKWESLVPPKVVKIIRDRTVVPKNGNGGVDSSKFIPTELLG